jgi:hypothetical protein
MKSRGLRLGPFPLRGFVIQEGCLGYVYVSIGWVLCREKEKLRVARDANVSPSFSDLRLSFHVGLLAIAV